MCMFIHLPRRKLYLFAIETVSAINALVSLQIRTSLSSINSTVNKIELQIKDRIIGSTTSTETVLQATCKADHKMTPFPTTPSSGLPFTPRSELTPFQITPRSEMTPYHLSPRSEVDYETTPRRDPYIKPSRPEMSTPKRLSITHMPDTRMPPGTHMPPDTRMPQILLINCLGLVGIHCVDKLFTGRPVLGLVGVHCDVLYTGDLSRVL